MLGGLEIEGSRGRRRGGKNSSAMFGEAIPYFECSEVFAWWCGDREEKEKQSSELDLSRIE